MLAKGVLFLAVGLFVSAAAKDDADNTAKKLEGKWNVVAGEEGGKRAAASEIKDATVTIRGTGLTVHKAGRDEEMTFAIRKGGNRGEIDFTLTAGPDKGKTCKGIYSLEDDTLRVTYAPPGEDRPREFATAKDTKQMSWTLKRASK
jgi:uncharacterized protein (TIGR03067 family)